VKEYVYFDTKDIELCQEHANEVWHKHRHFKDKENKTIRTKEQVINDVVDGKLAEIAVRKYFIKHHYPNVSDVDFKIYGEHDGDDYDLIVNRKTISIKCSKLHSHCLMIEQERMKYDSKLRRYKLEDKEAPDYLVFVQVDVKNKEYAVVCGGIEFKDFVKKKKFLDRNFPCCEDNLYDYFINNKKYQELDNSKGFKLLAKNWGLHINQLDSIQQLHI
jgi:hypothetical protein